MSCPLEVKVLIDRFVLAPVQLAELGAYQRGPSWGACVVVDGNIITGQNPSSAEGVGEAILKALS